ncbi:Glutamate--tRNA ligase [Candidatus Koribacter versatilis Ellin345]|uniref:Glutamate--tRNA ligase n=1 Tax=Koribacter versatilis (strain Ellin345) TaxID=204669 RepID=Q1IM72_KORVE|nr:tRNA glutamyl-Q synthetase [Candidatus Koribacter versatilis]ABF42028.1 Glutamate--tRNA ligase [Candidatus Koribacter versatilis Ellin345]
MSSYRGRIAPSPTGYLHLGHARTFWTAYQRSLQCNGTLIFRNEDLDPQRSKPEYASAMIEDLRWLGIVWQEGPDVGGPHEPYEQSKRREFYLRDWRLLVERGFVYPCTCSRKDLALSAQAPNEGDEEPVYPGKCRPAPGATFETIDPAAVNWRFRVPDGETIRFVDANLGERSYVAGKDFGDFVLWRRDDVPAYQLAVVTDDCDMQVTEVVRGEDLLVSTARQILLFNALGRAVPRFYHCPLLRDASGERLAKRTDALSLRELRKKGYTPEQIQEMWA